MFRTVHLSIISRFSLYTQPWYISYRFADSKAVWHKPLLCVQWKTPDDGQRNCPKHVNFYFKNKFEKLVYLVGFIVRIYHDAQSHDRKIRINLLIHSLLSYYRQHSALVSVSGPHSSVGHKVDSTVHAASLSTVAMCWITQEPIKVLTSQLTRSLDPAGTARIMSDRRFQITRRNTMQVERKRYPRKKISCLT